MFLYCLFFLMFRRLPISTRTYTLFPDTTLFRARLRGGTGTAVDFAAVDAQRFERLRAEMDVDHLRPEPQRFVAARLGPAGFDAILLDHYAEIRIGREQIGRAHV